MAITPILFFLMAGVSLTCVKAADKDTPYEPVLKPLIEALDEGGLEKLNSRLESGGQWPRITTDSLAAKEKNEHQPELAALSERLLGLLGEKAKAASADEEEKLTAEASLLFSLGEKLWKAGGYRNHVSGLFCSQLASYRCGKITLLTKGEKSGPMRPEIFRVKNADTMLEFFIAEIPESKELSISGLQEELKTKRISAESWVEILMKIQAMDLGGKSANEQFGESLVLGFKPLGAIASREDLSSLVMQYGMANVVHDSVLPSLALYLRKGGSLREMKANPTNATKFEAVMGDDTYRFSKRPVTRDHVWVDTVAVFVEALEKEERIRELLVGDGD